MNLEKRHYLTYYKSDKGPRILFLIAHCHHALHGGSLLITRTVPLTLYRLWGASHAPPPWKKALENRYRVEMHVHSPIFQGQLIENKIRSITFLVWVLGRVKKISKKVKKNVKNNFFFFKQISKCDTCFYIHFSRAF